MYQKDYNLLISNLSNKLKPINQLLYECLVLIIFYYIFNTISFLNNDSKIHKPFVYLIFVICILLDWFIWNSYIQTFLFIAILFIYINYNFTLSHSISTFIDSVNISRINNEVIKQNELNLQDIKIQQEIEAEKDKTEIDAITFIPKNFIPTRNPNPYEKNLNGINEINSAYSSNIPYLNINDSLFAEEQINALHNTPQYKNIKPEDVSNSISTDLLNDNTNGTSSSNNSSNSSNNNNDKKNINLFRNPKRVFLDDKWLNIKDNTYNDICNNCTGKNKGNAICSVVKYGRELEECTNQTDSVNNNQLQKISSNKVEPIYKF